MLPSKEGYMLPINKRVFDELDDTIKNNGYESNMNIKLSYYHNVSRKKQEIFLNIGFLKNIVEGEVGIFVS